VANLRNIFRQIMVGRVFRPGYARHAFAAKKPRLAARKIARTLAAFSLPQDSQVELMFGAVRFGEPALSASRSLGFHIAPRGGIHRVASTTRASASISSGFASKATARRAMILKRLQRRAFS
jgi:hypothetical protein